MHVSCLVGKYSHLSISLLETFILMFFMLLAESKSSMRFSSVKSVSLNRSASLLLLEKSSSLDWETNDIISSMFLFATLKTKEKKERKEKKSAIILRQVSASKWYFFHISVGKS